MNHIRWSHFTANPNLIFVESECDENKWYFFVPANHWVTTVCTRDLDITLENDYFLGHLRLPLK